MATKRLGVGVIGAGRWAGFAHLPGWARDSRCQIVGICDLDQDRASAAAAEFGAGLATTDYRELLKRDDIDIIDVVTRDGEHFALNTAAIDAGKHVLSEKPVAHDHHDVARLAERARSAGLKTKVGLTFRYSPAVRYMKDLIRSGSLGTPYIYNAYEQNSQWLNPQTPLRSRAEAADGPIQVASLEGYGAPVIDIGHWLMESDLTAVVGVLKNFVPERLLAATGAMARVEHRRWGHLHRRVRQRRDLLGADQLRHRRELPGHRGPGLRQRGSHHRQADRGIRDLRDAEDSPPRRRGVPRSRGAGKVLPVRRQSAGIMAHPVLRQPHR